MPTPIKIGCVSKMASKIKNNQKSIEKIEQTHGKMLFTIHANGVVELNDNDSQFTKPTKLRKPSLTKKRKREDDKNKEVGDDENNKTSPNSVLKKKKLNNDNVPEPETETHKKDATVESELLFYNELASFLISYTILNP